MMDINRIHMVNSLRKGIRFDGRKLTELRTPLSIDLDISVTAEGSSRVKLGNTIVIAGVKLEVSTPYPDTPKEGSLMVNAELIPMSSSEYESGPPSEKGIEVGRVIDRALREGHAIDMEELCIEEGKKAWTVIIDIIPINDDGNLIDAGTIAAIAALKNARFPTIKDDETVDYTKKTNKIPLNSVPLSVTLHKIEDKFIVDPTLEEESYSDARLTVAVKENGNPCSLQKGGMPLSHQEICNLIDTSILISKEYRKAIDKIK